MRTLEVDHAHSMDNGIRFYSKRHKGYVCISTVDESGNITTEWKTLKEQRKEKNKHDKISDIKKLLCILPFALFFAVGVAWIMSKDLTLGMRAWLIGQILISLSSFFISTTIDRKKDKNWLKFHSAEHMVLNAYRELKRVPSIDEISTYSRFSNSCGTNATTQMVVTFMLMFVATFISNPLYMMLGMLFSNIIVLIFLQCGLLNFMQILTTQKPTEQELLVAIEGMRVWLEHEKKEKEKTGISKIIQRLFPRAFT